MLELILKIILTAVVAVITSLIAYFGKRMIDQIEKKIDDGFKSVSTKLDKTENTLFQIQKDLHAHDVSLAVLKEKVDSLEEDCEVLGKTS